MRSQCTRLLALTLLALASGCHGHRTQQPANAYIQVDQLQLRSHILVEPALLRITQSEWNKLTHEKPGVPCSIGQDYFPYELHISPQGSVDDAKLQLYGGSCSQGNYTGNIPPDPPQFLRKYLPEAEALMRTARFRPWIINGHATGVVITSGILLAPPERYGPPHPFPTITDPLSITIKLEQYGCLGKCPEYNVAIHGDGTVNYSSLGNVAVTGSRVAHISPQSFDELLSHFKSANFFSALPNYEACFDGGGTILTLAMGSESHTVRDACGQELGIPTAVRKLESAVNQAANTHQWVYGN
ncbi:MAG: DUF6438 domain-containing protein [Acidobacteriota bacterium]